MESFPPAVPNPHHEAAQAETNTPENWPQTPLFAPSSVAPTIAEDATSSTRSDDTRSDEFTPRDPEPETRSPTLSPTLIVRELAERLRHEVGKAVVGQDEIITQFLVAILVRGHVLLEGVPGIAKTLTAKSLAHVLSATFKRVQFTPDLMPADVVGTNVFDARTSEFSLRRGPIFTDMLLADEINRTPPKTQAALLEAMQERRATIDGESHVLSPMFTVFATQNPIDYEGTYPLPEAQLDRFTLKVLMDYPNEEEESALLARVHRGFDAHELADAGLQPVVDSAGLEACRRAVQGVTVSEGMVKYITTIVRRTRDLPTLTLGASPRASIALLQCAKAFAALNGRDFVIPEDVKTVALPVLRHRVLVRAEAEMEGTRPDAIVRGVLDSVEVPR